MKFGVVSFPGTTAAKQLAHTLRKVLRQDVVELWHETAQLGDFNTSDCIILPGGSSYADYLRPGALAKLSPMMTHLANFAQQGGYVFGIGNGFQILCEAGLLPGAFLPNENGRFLCKNVYLKTITSNSPITAAISPDEVLQIPIAHQFGGYYISQTALQILQQNDQILFKYSSALGDFSDQYNPNGSVDHIAGICNADRNVFALMPHPEKAVRAMVHNEDGRIIFEYLFRTANTDVFFQ
ncbi:MAG: phosphoribosylformylglycinamidine synthase I [Bacteroidota bacterium]